MAQKHGKTRATAKVPQKTTRAWDALTPALSDWILEAVNSLGFDRMTPVQASTIPLFLGNKDPVVEVFGLHQAVVLRGTDSLRL